jgi:hypothetical protein
MTDDKKLHGYKKDEGKTRMDLIPVDVLEELGKVYTMGALKYADRNWEKGMHWGRVYAALLRHLFAWWGGENIDKESGLSHMAHVIWGAFTLLAYSKRAIGIDNRPTSAPEENIV